MHPRTQQRKWFAFSRTITALMIALLIFLGCQSQMKALAQNLCGIPERFFNPEVEIQKEDYAKVRRSFSTRLTRQGPAPQEEKSQQPSEGVSQVEFGSGKPRLKGWINRRHQNFERRDLRFCFFMAHSLFGPDDWKMAEPYRDAGYIVMVPMLRGENAQAGCFSMFYDEIEDVLAAANFLSKQHFVDSKRLYVAGHSAGGTLALLAALTTSRFRAAAAFDGSPDQQLLFNGSAQRPWVPKEVVFDRIDLRDLQVRSPLAYAYSFKVPTRLYYSTEASCLYQNASVRMEALAKERGSDVEAVKIEGTHFSHVPAAMKQSIRFFRANERAETRRPMNLHRKGLWSGFNKYGDQYFLSQVWGGRRECRTHPQVEARTLAGATERKDCDDPRDSYAPRAPLLGPGRQWETGSCSFRRYSLTLRLYQIDIHF